MIEPRPVSELLKAPIPDADSGKKAIRLLACGVPEGVDGMVHNLHVLGFAEVGEWSPALPSPVKGEVIRILTRYIKSD
jgi:hypothetical protein